jgi:hypothetical protein
MRNLSSTLTVFATLLLASASGCSDDEGSYVGNGSRPGTGGSSTTGGKGSTAGTSGMPKAGTANQAGETGTGVIPTEACMGLPIDLSVDGQGGAPAAAGGAPGNAGGEAGGGGAAEPDPDPETGGVGGESGESCRGLSQAAEAVPVDVFMMMDRSQSMGFPVEGSDQTRWEALRDAVQSFAENPDAGNIRAGIGFFSLSGGDDEDLDCDADNYAEPVVPIDVLADTGADLVAAIEDTEPSGLTPTVPALQGAISYARSWAQENPERATMVVLVSDGFPTQCETGPDQVAAAAKEGFESDEHVRTFVIGVGDVARFNLDNYARAGGTGKAYLTEADNVSDSFVEALNNITDSKLACQYAVPQPPSGMKIDTNKVQVIYTPASSGEPEEVPSVLSLSDCADSPNGGWYYDDPAMPTKITVCPCTCARFGAGQVDVRLGCKPRLGLR